MLIIKVFGKIGLFQSLQPGGVKNILKTTVFMWFMNHNFLPIIWGLMPRYDEVPCLLALQNKDVWITGEVTLIRLVKKFTTDFLQNAETVEVIDNDMRLRIACV